MCFVYFSHLTKTAKYVSIKKYIFTIQQSTCEVVFSKLYRRIWLHLKFLFHCSHQKKLHNCPTVRGQGRQTRHNIDTRKMKRKFGTLDPRFMSLIINKIERCKIERCKTERCTLKDAYWAMLTEWCTLSDAH